MKRQFALLAAIGAAVAFGLSARTYAAHSDYGCHNCHVPHHSGPDASDPHPERAYGVPLWSPVQQQDAPIPDYTLYSSKTFNNLNPTIVQPQGPTKLCLGCHDGTGVYEDDAKFDAATGLATSHPVSVVYDAALVTASGDALEDPLTKLSGTPTNNSIDADLLDDQHMVQCTSCHDPHTTAVNSTYMLRWAYEAGKTSEATMCRTCHKK